LAGTRAGGRVSVQLWAGMGGCGWEADAARLHGSGRADRVIGCTHQGVARAIPHTQVHTVLNSCNCHQTASPGPLHNLSPSNAFGED